MVGYVSPSARRVLFLAAVLVASACAPGLKVARLKPSRFNLGATRNVAVLQVNGHPQAASQVMVELQRQIANGGHYQLINAVNRGLTITISSANARVDVNSLNAQVPADVYVVANVLRYEAWEEEQREERTEKGRKYKVTKIYPKARAVVNFQVVKADGHVIVFRDYEETASGSSYERGERRRYSRQDLKESAVREAVESFIFDITPRRVVEKIELDDDDPALKPGIERAEAGDLEGAERAWRAVLARQPSHPGATYNIGVLLETRGEFEAAEAAYREAYGLSPKALYREALDDLHQRLYDAQSLQTHL